MTDYGMIAFGRSGGWEISVDELVGESSKWALQIESAVVSFQCAIGSIRVLRDLQNFLDVSDTAARKAAGPFDFGSYYGQRVAVVLDNEFADRCFLIIGDSATARFEVKIAGDELSDFQSALSQVVAELES